MLKSTTEQNRKCVDMLNMKATTSKDKCPFASTSCWVAAHSPGELGCLISIFTAASLKVFGDPQKHRGKVTELPSISNEKLPSDMHKRILTVVVREGCSSIHGMPA